MEAQIAVFAGLIPGITSGVVLLALWLWISRRASVGCVGSGAPVRSWSEAAGLAAPAALVMVCTLPVEIVVIRGGFSGLWPLPRAGSDRVVHALAVIGAAGVVEALAGAAGARAWMRGGVRVAGALGALWLTCGWWFFPSTGGGGAAVGIGAGSAARATQAVAFVAAGIAAALAGMPGATAERRTEAIAGIGAVFVGACAGPVVLLKGGNATLSAYSASIVAVLGASLAVAFLVKRLRMGSGFGACGSALVVLVVTGRAYAEDQPWVWTAGMGLACAAPLIACVGRMRSKKKWTRTVTVWLVACAGCAASIGLAVRGTTPAETSGPSAAELGY